MPTGTTTTPECIEQMRKLRAEGVSCRDIADKLGVCESTVTRYTKGVFEGRTHYRDGDLKRCSKCHELKPLHDFHKGERYLNDDPVPLAYCKECKKELDRAAWQRRDRKLHPERYKDYDRWKLEKLKADTERHAAAVERNRAYHRELVARQKREVMDKYGGVCACCGESRIEFLSIDHINGGGNKHRRETGGGGANFYRWLRNNDYPEGFRVLCHNCNQAIGYCGYCPHEREKQK